MERPAEPSESGGKENVTAREQQQQQHQQQPSGTLKGEEIHKKKVYFEIDDRNTVQDVLEVSNFKIEEMFRTPSKGCDDDGIAHETPSGRDHISPTKPCLLPLNSGSGGMIFDELGIDLIEFQNRLLELEKQLKNDNLGLPTIISDLKSKVENFKNKLDAAEHFNRTEFGKEPICQRFQYRRTSNERVRKIREKFLEICEMEVSESTKDWLKRPSFDSSQFKDEEILLFLQHMFLELELISRFNIRLPILRNFLYEVYKNYNEVPFHNFRHCFCVAQMMYVIAWAVDIPNRMGYLDTLILLTSCICHDLDHPGYNNIYQINARTELALRYNDISPLENHHCSVAFRILENPECNIFATIDKETFKEIREGIIRCILATDMARHNEILTQFKDITPEFDFNNKAHKNLLSMILIKVADISNEARPMNVAEPWLDRLLMEFFKQSDAEKQEGLPVTPFMDREKITKPSSQCSFIGFVLLPLFEALGELLPELHELIIIPAKDALEHYRRLNEAAKDERMRRKSVVEIVTTESGDDTDSIGMVKSGSGHSVRSRKSLGASSSQSRQRSKSSEDCDTDLTPPSSPGGLSGFLDDLEDFDERDEEEEEETVTEVEVSEKTLKFKISTEGSTTSFHGRKSCPGSRKGSRERNQYLDNDSEWNRMMKEEEDDGRPLKRSITSDTMDSRKGSSDSEKISSGKNSRKGSGESVEDGRRPNKHDDHRRKTSYQNERMYDYRRKSLAVVERMRERDISKRRRSMSNTQEAKIKEVTVKKEKDEERRECRNAENKINKEITLDDMTLAKLDISNNENRYSRDFETSCWGLQNLKKNSTVFNKTPIVINSNKTFKNSLEKNIDSEKSKSEDNLTIKSSEHLSCSSRLGNNINTSKTDDSIEKQLQGELDKRKKVGSSGHLSFLATKFKNFKDKMSFKLETDEIDNTGPNIDDKTLKSNSDNQTTSKECEDDSEKSRTLPKTKKPRRTSAKMRKGWRALIGKSEGNASSSLELLPPPGSPSPVHSRSNRKSSIEDAKSKSMDSSNGDNKRRSNWLSSPKRSGFLLKMNRSEDESVSKNTFLNNLTSSFRKKSSKNDEESGASSSTSMQEGSKPN